MSDLESEQLNVLYKRARQRGSTNALGSDFNTIYHQLELKNLLKSGHQLPGFFKNIPEDDLINFLNISVGGNVIGF